MRAPGAAPTKRIILRASALLHTGLKVKVSGLGLTVKDFVLNALSASEAARVASPIRVCLAGW